MAGSDRELCPIHPLCLLNAKPRDTSPVPTSSPWPLTYPKWWQSLYAHFPKAREMPVSLPFPRREHRCLNMSSTLAMLMPSNKAPLTATREVQDQGQEEKKTWCASPCEKPVSLQRPYSGITSLLTGRLLDKTSLESLGGKSQFSCPKSAQASPWPAQQNSQQVLSLPEPLHTKGPPRLAAPPSRDAVHLLLWSPAQLPRMTPTPFHLLNIRPHLPALHNPRPQHIPCPTHPSHRAAGLPPCTQDSTGLTLLSRPWVPGHSNGRPGSVTHTAKQRTTPSAITQSEFASE